MENESLIISPRKAFRNAGTGYNSERLQPGKHYRATLATNQHNHESEKKIFVITSGGTEFLLSGKDYAVTSWPERITVTIENE